MANIKSAQKQARRSIKRRSITLIRRTSLKTAIKKVLAAVASGDHTVSLNLLRNAESQLARAKNKSVIHSGNASRRIGRLAKKVAALQSKTIKS